MASGTTIITRSGARVSLDGFQAKCWAHLPGVRESQFVDIEDLRRFIAKWGHEENPIHVEVLHACEALMGAGRERGGSK